MKHTVILIAVVALAAVARAQPTDPVPPTPAPQAPTPAPQAPTLPPADAPAPTPPDPGTSLLVPTRADPATCLALDTAPGALLEPVHPTGELDTPIPWTEFVVDGELIDPPETLHALLEPTMQDRRTTLSNASWKDIAAMTARFGYQLVGHVVTDAPNGTRLVLHVAPLPMVRKVKVNFPARFKDLFGRALEDEVRRRVRVRTGSYLPWEPIRRQCAIADERQRIEDYLHDEGYADARAQLVTAFDRTSVKLIVEIDLGDEYKTGKVTIAPPAGGEVLALSEAEIKKQFVHKDYCLPGGLCFSRAGFNRTQHQEDLQKVREMFHKKGYPAVRVQSSFDPRISFDRRSKTVSFTITIDQRRPIDVQFEGQDRDALPDEELRKHLTFDTSGSADDVEAASSAKALVEFLQSRNYFEARVTVERQRAAVFDKLTFHIDQGPLRDVRSVSFAGNHVLTTEALGGIVATHEAGFRGTLLGTNVAATSAQIANDVIRIKDAYRRAGHREAAVTASASSDPQGLDNAALTAALALAEIGDGVYVRFSIDEGQPTLLSRVAINFQGGTPEKQATLCELMLRELATELGEPQFATRDLSAPTACVATAANLAFREDDVAGTRERLREFLYRSGRPRATVDFEAKPLGPHRMSAQYTVRSIDELRVGKIVIRGAFRTMPWVILGELPFHEGDLLTTDALAEGARRLRNTGLFNAINIDLPDLCGNQTTSQAGCQSASLVVNAVVRVEERYDDRIQIDLQVGYSSFNGAFAGIGWHQGNVFGRGIDLKASFTYGTKIFDLESTLLFPPWLVRSFSPVDFRTELTGLVKQQDTPRFGLLTTEGFTVGFSKPWLRQRTATVPARSLTLGIHYDFRLRTREVDVLRPIGANGDSAQVAVGTRTGSVGVLFDWEQRTDRRGNLAPLSPEIGHRLELSASLAHQDLFGQDAFIKLSATGSKFILIGNNLVIRGDLRYDQGIPLGGAVLLPEVERFFAGGDSTVRGYSDDRMATELIQVGVPPVGNLTQIRVIPAGGNIRMLGSLDAQVRIWKILAGAMFTDAGMITNDWSTVGTSDVRPSVGMGLRVLTPFGVGAFEYAIPLRPKLGDDPRGRIHFYFAARAQF